MQPVDPLVAELIDSLPTTPAVVTNERFDVIASNAVARAVSPSLTAGVNLAEATFVNLSARETLPRWSEVSVRMIELLKEAVADPDRAGHNAERFTELRAELTLRSTDFAIAWRNGTLPSSYALDVSMDHPDVGRLDITYELLRLPDSRQLVVMGHTVPGSESEQRLFWLAAHSDMTPG